MDEDWAWSVISRERRSLADLLDGLTRDEWESPSLCSRWRIRDVTAHLAMVPNPPGFLQLGLGMARAHGDFNELNRAIAVRHARLEPAELVAELREHADSRTMPVVTNSRNLLFDILVHGQDIAVPLGIPRRMDAEAARVGADRVWRMGWPFRARRRLQGLRLVATDVDWSVGSGDEVTGPVQAMLLLLTGRPAALGELTGVGAPDVARRLAT